MPVALDWERISTATPKPVSARVSKTARHTLPELSISTSGVPHRKLEPSKGVDVQSTSELGYLAGYQCWRFLKEISGLAASSVRLATYNDLARIGTWVIDRPRKESKDQLAIKLICRALWGRRVSGRIRDSIDGMSDKRMRRRGARACEGSGSGCYSSRRHLREIAPCQSPTRP